MPAQYDLTNEYVSSTYGRLLQIASSSIYDGYGNDVSLFSGSSVYTRESVSIQNATSSYSYQVSQQIQPWSIVLIFYNGILLNTESYSRTNNIFTLDSNFNVFPGDYLDFLFYTNSSGSVSNNNSASYSNYAATASYLLGSISSASYSLYAVSSSMAATASYYNGVVISSSYAESASYAPFPETSSYSLSALSASWAPGSNSISSSYATSSSYSDFAPSSSYAVSSSWAPFQQSSSFAETSNTASYYNGSVISSSYANTSSYSNQSLSSSYSTFVPYIQTIGSRISTEDSYITAGSKGYKHIGFKSSIVKARTITNETGSIDVNIKRNGTLLGNINITNSTGSYDNVLSGWTSQLNEDDLIEFYVSGSSTYITDITIFIDIKARQ